MSMSAIFKRELRSYYTSLSGYVAAAVLLLFTGIYTVTLNLIYGYPNFEYVLDYMTLVYILLIPLLTMQLLSAERKQKTDQLLYSLPLTFRDIVLGKFFAAWVSLGIPLVIAAAYPLILGCFGSVNYASAYASLLAFYLIGGALTSVGLFLSALTENPFIAGILCFFILLADFFSYSLSVYVSSASYASFMALLIGVLIFAGLIWFMTKNFAAALTFAVVADGAMLVCYLISPAIFGGVAAKILRAVCVFNQMAGFINGVFDLRAVFYFLSVMAVFLFLTTRALEKRRWN